ncbi:MAG: 30S ribosome-binding factor RbfA [Bacteroidales bacterium]|nr:30S ribosome-binding factor RbfA [Bacteroidales bacterium]
MQATRQQKIARLMQKDLGDIFLRYAKRIGNLLISVSEVRVSPDLSIAHIYLSIFPSNRAEDVLQHIMEDQKTIRFELGNLEHNQLRIIPELNFHLDTTLDHMERIDQLLGK